MVSFMDLLTAYGVPSLSVILAGGIYASSFPMVRRARILRNIDNLDAVTLTVQFVTAQTWLMYATVAGDPFIWTSSNIGVAFTTFYVATILELAVANGRLAMRGKVEVIYAAGMLWLFVLATMNNFGSFTNETRTAMVGYAGNLLSILMAVAPALNIIGAFRERSATCIQIPLNIVSFISGVTWCLYSLSKGDMFVFASSLVGTILATAQLLTVLIFLKSDIPKRRTQAKSGTLEKLKVAVIQQDYENQRGGTYVPLEFDSEYLARRLALRVETGQTDLVDRQETTATALLGVPIQDTMADVVLCEIAKEQRQMTVIVTSNVPGAPQGSYPPSHAVVQTMAQTLQHVGHVECRQVGKQDESGANPVFSMSLLPETSEVRGSPLQRALVGQRTYSPIRDRMNDSLAPRPSTPCPVLEVHLGQQGTFVLSCSSLPDLQAQGDGNETASV